MDSWKGAVGRSGKKDKSTTPLGRRRAAVLGPEKASEKDDRAGHSLQLVALGVICLFIRSRRSNRTHTLRTHKRGGKKIKKGGPCIGTGLRRVSLLFLSLSLSPSPLDHLWNHNLGIPQQLLAISRIHTCIHVMAMLCRYWSIVPKNRTRSISWSLIFEWNRIF